MLRRERRRRKPRERSRRRGWEISIEGVAVSGVTLFILGLSFLYVLQTTALRSLTAEISQAEERLVSVEEINRTLSFEIEQSFSLERVSRIARDRLGMVEPSVVRYVSLPSGD